MPDKCRSCGAEVLFVPSAKTGKLCILDATPVKGGSILVQRVDGKMVAVHLSKDDLFGMPGDDLGYRDHHSTCPQAQQWRKSKVKDS